ncbi:hypothetical protein ACP275_09G079600 [Erythranthe tilingii]
MAGKKIEVVLSFVVVMALLFSASAVEKNIEPNNIITCILKCLKYCKGDPICDYQYCKYLCGHHHPATAASPSGAPPSAFRHFLGGAGGGGRD